MSAGAFMAFVGSLQADFYVARNGLNTDTPPYDSWGNAASNIQDAVTAAAEGDTVWIGPGIYTVPSNPTNYLGLNVVYLNKPLTLQGIGTEPEDVIIDGEDLYRGIAIEAPGASTTPYIFRNLTVARGSTTNNGGGILFGGSAGTWAGVVDHCVIRDCEAVGSADNNSGGGGVYAYWTTGYFSLTLSNSVLRGNTTAGYGGGGLRVRMYFKPVELVNCVVEDNRADRGGGVYWDPHAQMTLEACTIRNNQAIQATKGSGGGLYHASSSAPFTMRNCLVYGNTSKSAGGAFYSYSAALLHIENSTITSNRSSASSNVGSGIYIRASKLVVTNSIVQRNASDLNLSFYNDADRDASYLSHVCVSPTNDLPGTALIEADLAFINFDGGDYRLSSASPCVNAGLTLPWMAGARDLVGERRVDAISGIVDLGCFERHELGTLLQIR